MKDNKTAKILAQALDRACQKKSQQQIDLVLANFEKLLTQKHWWPYLSEVIRELEVIENSRQNIIKVNLFSAHQLDAAEAGDLADIVSRLSGKKVILETGIDHDLLGGAILNYDDKVLDLSLKNKLANLAEHLVS
ncbi:MAG: ATP synthase F1 subunit delta [Patescibacteria group bacterium]